jgi:3',5'-cyclic-AMP phosphodiesterase
MLVAQLTDLHVCARGRAANRVSETNMFAERAFRAVAAAPDRPDIVLLTGDLTENGLATEYQELAEMLRQFPLPVFVIPGNHDQRGPLREHLANLPLVGSDPDFVQYVIEDYPLRLVMLDTLVPGAGHGELCAERLRFLNQTLAAAPERPTIVAMHHPPFHSGIPHMDDIALRHPEGLATVIARHPQVERIVCGHVHRTIFARVAHAVVSVAPSVAHQVDFTLAPDGAAGLIFEPPAYHLHRWTPQTGVVTHMVYVDRFCGPFPFIGDDLK